VAESLVERWGLGKAKDRFRARVADGRIGVSAAEAYGESPGGGGEAGSGPVPPAGRPRPRVAVLCPQTFMNDSGRSVGPARGSYKLPLEQVVVVYDEIDLPFGQVRTRLGGGSAGHNGMKSLKRELGGGDFWRVRVGVGRPETTDPEIVSAHVLGRFREDRARVDELIEHAALQVERLVLGEGGGLDGGGDGSSGPGERGGDAGGRPGSPPGQTRGSAPDERAR